MAVTVMVTLLLLMPLFQYTPNVILGAIIVTAVIGLIDVPAACQIWKIDKFDFLVMLCAFLGVLFISVEEGLAIAVGISIFKVLLQITRPKTLVLGNIPGTNIYRDLHHYKEAVSVPGFLILSIEAPINFANTTYLKERYEKNIKFYHLISFLSQPWLLSVRITRWMEEYETDSENSKNKSQLKFVILDLSGEFTTKTPIILWSFWTNKSHFCEMAFITCSCECNRYKWCLIFQRFEDGSGEEKHGGKSIYMSKARVFETCIWFRADGCLFNLFTACVGESTRGGDRETPTFRWREWVSKTRLSVLDSWGSSSFPCVNKQDPFIQLCMMSMIMIMIMMRERPNANTSFLFFFCHQIIFVNVAVML